METRPKVTHVISSINKRSGGPSFYMKALMESLKDKVDQNLISWNSNDSVEIGVENNIQLIPRRVYSKIYDPLVIKALEKSNTQIFHGNGLWEYPVHKMATIARKRQLPYILSPHGMLEPWSLRQGKHKKQIALRLFQDMDLNMATCLHATAPMEMQNFRKLGLRKPVAMIPNGIEVMEFPKKRPLCLHNSKRLLFLSRIHPKKGIELLIRSFTLLSEENKYNWTLDIVGDGEAGYINKIQRLIFELSMEDKIRLIGPVYGESKIVAYHQADLMVLPTFSENFGIVVLEALACGTPVITTKGAPWEDLVTYNCGWWIEIGLGPLIFCLKQAMQLSNDELFMMGHRGRKLVEQKYCMTVVAAQFLELYKWVIGETGKPNFVNTI